MRILHVLASLKGGGIQNFLVSLAPEQINLGNEVFVLVIDEDNIDYSASLQLKLNKSNILVYHLNRKISSKWSTLKSILRTRKIIHSIDPDIVNTHGVLSHVFGSIATVFTNYKHCCTIHSAPEHWSIVSKMLIGKKPLIYCSDAALVLRGQLGFPMIAINNGVDLNAVRTNSLVGLKKDLGLNESVKLVVLVGSLRPEKNYSFLIKIVEKINDPNIHYCICGGIYKVENSGSNNRYFISTEQFSKYSNIHFLGLRTDVPAILNECDVYLSCSIREGLPISALEAFICGIPCVLSPIYQHKAISDGIANCYIPVNFDSESFANSICQALSCKESHDSIYEKRKNNLRRFDICRCAKQYVEFYNKLLNA